MTLAATEHLKFAARAHRCAHVHLDRYVVTAYDTTVAVFDTTTNTSRAFSLGSLALKSMGPQNVFTWDDRLFLVAASAPNQSSGPYSLVEILLADGTADVYSTGLQYANFEKHAAAYLVGDRLWICSSGSIGHVYLPTMVGTQSRHTGTTVGFVANGTAFDGVYRWTASTGAALANGPSVGFPNTNVSVAVTVGTVAHWNSYGSETISRWDTAADTSISSVNSATLGPMHLAADGLLWSANATAVRAFNPATLAIRTDTFPTSRSERVAAVRVGSKIWAPSGYPI